MLVAPIRGYWILNPQRSGKFIFLKVVNWFSLFKQVDKLYLLDKTQRFRPLLKQKCPCSKLDKLKSFTSTQSQTSINKLAIQSFRR
uniref:Uncharacterized protein n=1 Tax=Trichobilharzia regenti TaxID=157069 RepID=A0AA85IKZ6_TRIRE|nr:unnamed protein product [Trichobilharzia regenti]